MEYDVLFCPYCGAEQMMHEPEEVSGSGMEECEVCGKRFWYSVAVIREYNSGQCEGPEADGEQEGGEE